MLAWCTAPHEKRPQTGPGQFFVTVMHRFPTSPGEDSWPAALATALTKETLS